MRNEMHDLNKSDEDTTSQGWSMQYGSYVLKMKKVNYLGWKETFKSIHDLGIKWGKQSQKGKRLKSC
jgi:hypothetical protein